MSVAYGAGYAVPQVQIQAYGATSDTQLMSVQQPQKSYSFDASCCCGTEIDEVDLRDDVLHISKRYGCCGCGSSDDIVVKTRQIEMSEISTKNNSKCAIFTGWLLLGCLGSHRLCSGRKVSGLIMGWFFLLSLTMTITSWTQYDGATVCTLEDTEYSCIYYPNHQWLVPGMISSIVLAFIVIWWFIDLFRLRYWTHTIVDIKTMNGKSNVVRIPEYQKDSFRTDLEAAYRV